MDVRLYSVYAYLLFIPTLFVQTNCQTPYLSPQNSSTAVQGNMFQFNCTLSESDSLNGNVRFQRGHAHFSNMCTVNINCSQFQNNSNYTCGCVSEHILVLNITSVRKLDGANWRCQYKANYFSNNASLTVYYAPTINISTNKDVRENTRLNINCSSNITPGNPSNTSYRWTGPGSYSKTGAVLNRTVNRTQGGQYTCTATNTAGLSDTATVNINVQYAPVITSVSMSKDVTENTSSNINCSSNITPGNPSSTSYRWTGPGGYSKTGAVLDRTVTRTQGGQYTCTATNTAGLSDTSAVNISVQYVDIPSIAISPVQVMENDRVQMVCSVASNPIVQMTIRNVDNTTNLVDQEVTNSRQYVIDRVQCLHNGTYQCLAENRGIPREQNASTSLRVLCSPRHDYTKNFTRTLVKGINETATLVADVISNPLPNFTWWRYNDGQLEPILNSTIYSVHSTDLKSVLEICVSHSRDYGTYAALVENTVDTTLMTFELTATSHPFAPHDIDEIVGPTTVTLQWISNFNGGANQRFFVEYRSLTSAWKNPTTDGIKDPGRGKLVTVNVTQGLEPNTEYFFKVYSVNSYGVSDIVTINVTTSKASTINGDGINIAAIAAGLGAGLLVIIIVSTVVLLYKKGVCGTKDKPIKDVVMSERRDAANERAEMEDNVLYESSGDINTAAAAEAFGGDVYAVVQKKKPATDVYAVVVKPKKGKGAATAKHDKKRVDKKPLKSEESIADIYESAGAWQFEDGSYATTHVNAGFEGEDTAN